MAANRYRTFVNNQETLMTASDTSTTAISGNLVALNSSGKVDTTLLPSSLLYSYITPVTISGNVSATTIFTSASTGYYNLAILAETISTASLVAGTITIGFTSRGVSRILTQPTISLTTSTGAMSSYQLIYADNGTAVTYSVSGITAGSLRLSIGWKQG